MEFVSLRSRTDMIPTSLQHNPYRYLDCYTLTKIRMCKSKIDKLKVIVVEVTMGRPIINNLLTVFVPTMLLVNISFTARLPKRHKVLKWSIRSIRSKRSIRFQRSLSLSVSISVFLSVFVFAFKFKSLLVPINLISYWNTYIEIL